MFTKDLASEHTDKDHSLPPFNLLFELCRHQPVREHLLSFLGAQDLQKLGLATGVKYPGYQRICNGLFFGCKEHYLMRTRLKQA